MILRTTLLLGVTVASVPVLPAFRGDSLRLPRTAIEMRQSGSPTARRAPLIDTTRFDPHTSPCADFYQYANGGWLQRTVISPEDTATDRLWNLAQRDRVGIFNEVAHQTRATLLQVLTAARTAAATTTDPVTRVVGTFYGSCLAAPASDTTSTTPQTQREREWHCFAATDSLLGSALGQLYYRAVLPTAQHRAQAEALVESLRAAFRARLTAAAWISDSTRHQALLKLAAMSVQIGVPDSDEDYRNLTLTAIDYTGNRRAVKEFEWQRHIAAIGISVTQVPWLFRSYVMNAAEHKEDNMVEIPAVLWQPPLFDPTGDVAANYGALGFVISHELMHGFGPMGRYFAAHHVRFDWIAPPDTAAFTQRTQRLVQQFNAFPLPAGPTDDAAHVNGSYTLEENLADVNGLRVAYTAFEQAMRGKSPTRLQGLTPEQRFFLAVANFFRAKSTLSAVLERQRTYIDMHAPDRFRVNGAVSNMPEFARAFGCHAGDPMVRAPDQRVEIW